MTAHDDSLYSVGVDCLVKLWLHCKALVSELAYAIDSDAVALLGLCSPAVVNIFRLRHFAACNLRNLIHKRCSLHLCGEAHYIARTQEPVLSYLLRPLALNV